jgi:hypothetical protein
VNCEDFRDRWDDHDRSLAEVVSHHAACADCAGWVQRESAFDSLVRASVVVAPPPELIARLAPLPARVYAAVPAAAPVLVEPAPSPYSLALEAALIAVIGFAAISFGGFDPLAWLDMALAHAGTLLQAIPLIVDSLLPYAQGLAMTAIEALATLALVALSILPRNSDPAGYPPRREPTAQ